MACILRAGSATSVARLALIAATALPESRSPGLRKDTGTMALRGWSGNSACVCKYCRSAPEHMARTASLNVPPKALPMASMRAKGQD